MFDSLAHSIRRFMFIGREKFKIVNSVICSISVFMMNRFPGFQWTAKMFRHYKTMFINFTTLICHWMMNTKKYFHISMWSLFSLKRTISMFFLPCKMNKTFPTNACKDTCFQFHQNHIFSPRTNISTFATSDINHNSLRSIRIGFLKLFIPRNDRTRIEDLFIFFHSLFSHSINYAILKRISQEEV